MKKGQRPNCGFDRATRAFGLRLPFVLCPLILFSFPSCSLVGVNSRVEFAEHGVFYEVRAGDTLSSIGRRYGVPFDQIAKLNGLRNVDELDIGQLLLIAYTGASALRSSSSPKAPSSSTASTLLTPRPPSGGRLLWPVSGRGRFVSGFGPRGGRFHDGIDIAAPSGTPVVASHDGRVAYSGSRLRGYGKLLIVRSNDGIATVYAHNRRLLVSKGAEVRRGQKIAEVGSTGRSSGPHLHFEVRVLDRKGRYVAVDPMPLLSNSGKAPRYRVNNNLRGVLAKY